MKRVKKIILAATMALGATLIPHGATAAPTDGGFPWSWGGLKVANMSQGGDNEVYVNFRNPDGSIRTVWPDSRGVDLCGGRADLRVTRARTNFKELVDALTAAGLAGRQVWVAYEPTGGVCYVKAVSVAMQ